MELSGIAGSALSEIGVDAASNRALWVVLPSTGRAPRCDVRGVGSLRCCLQATSTTSVVLVAHSNRWSSLPPKSLPGTKEPFSEVAWLLTGVFEPLLEDAAVSEGAHRLVLSAGKVFYDLAPRKQEAPPCVAVCRLPELYPIPEDRPRRSGRAVTPMRPWCGRRRSPRTWAPNGSCGHICGGSSEDSRFSPIGLPPPARRSDRGRSTKPSKRRMSDRALGI